MDRNDFQNQSKDTNIQTDGIYAGQKPLKHQNPYRFAAIIMFLIIFASIALPNWFVASAKIRAYAYSYTDSESTSELDQIHVYTYKKLGDIVFNMLLQTSNNNDYNVNCSSMAKSISIFTFVFFILSLLMYITASHMKYSLFMINGLPFVSIALLIFQAFNFNQNNITIMCSDNIQISYTMGIVWWVALILLAIVAIINIRISKEKPSNLKTETTVKKETIEYTDYGPTADGMWACKKCGTHNKNNYGQCKKCGSFRKG